PVRQSALRRPAPRSWRLPLLASVRRPPDHSGNVRRRRPRRRQGRRAVRPQRQRRSILPYARACRDVSQRPDRNSWPPAGPSERQPLNPPRAARVRTKQLSSIRLSVTLVYRLSSFPRPCALASICTNRCAIPAKGVTMLVIMCRIPVRPTEQRQLTAGCRLVQQFGDWALVIGTTEGEGAPHLTRCI